jgi:hypothetical protein
MDTESAREMIERNYHPKQTGPAPKDEGMEIRTGFLPRPEEATERCAVELRAVYERAFWAGIANDLCMEFAHRDALVIVRQWPAMTAERDALIAKAVQG